ncbi:MAG: reverse transcriptase/maturase family protein [Candidatus Wallbacteria bacterium]|nr:reverse transcriptase/maturase family protein [Candidatus Wallbacteria bacterium]
MKRAGNLIELIADADNLRLAFYKACRGKRGKSAVLQFREDLDYELAGLRSELLSGSVNWGAYHSFQVCDPKTRTIFASPFRTRVAHHAVINICEPVFESYQIFDSYACRRGKGLDAAIGRAVNFSKKGDWFLKLDVKKYFDSIDHQILLGMLQRKFKDRIILRLFDSILNSFETAPGKGVPIGNLTSQYFSNHYLGLLDHYVKEKLRHTRFVRYMDDFVLWSADKTELKESCKKIKGFLRELLKLELNPVCLNNCNRGMTFLGYRIYPSAVTLARRSRDRFRRKFSQYTKLFDAGIWSESQLSRHMDPLLSFISRVDSWVLRERVISEYGFCPEAPTA